MPYKILVVDDLDTNRELVEKILKTDKNSFEVICAKNGKEGFEIAATELPDLVLMDLKMPDYDGIYGIKQLQKDDLTKNIPIIVLTAYKSSDNLKESFELGAFDYLTKPLNVPELRSRVKKALKITDDFKKIQRSIDKYKDKANEFSQMGMFSGHSQQSFLIINTNGELEWANKGFEHLHGYTLEDFKTKFGNTIFSLYNEPEIITLFNDCVANMVPLDYISTVILKTGEIRWLQTFISPKINNDGTIDKLIGTEIDISNLKKKEEELNLQNKRMQTIMQNLEKANKQLEEQKQEINQQKQRIQEEQTKSEKLLLNMFPFEIAKQLKSKGMAGTRQYKMVSVIFADFKEFSKRTKELEPIDLVNILDTYFAKFDEIIGKYYLEKIKTIGDAYMCAGGLPLRNRSNPVDAVMAAIEIQNFMNQLNDSRILNNLSVWELRVGIHTGSVVAGVVGRKKFAYDIWGETVNIASRMQAGGHVGMVNVSDTTYKYIKDFFECDYRGKIEAKNIGKIDMYFVNRLKPEFSNDKYGLEPNEQFINLKNKL